MKNLPYHFGVLICLVFNSSFVSASPPNELNRNAGLIYIDTSSQTNQVVNFPNKYFTKLNGKTNQLDEKLEYQTEKYIRKIEKQEAKLKRKLLAFDSAAVNTLFSANPEQQFNMIEQKMKSSSVVSSAVKLSGDYYANADSLLTSLEFFNKNPKFLSNTKLAPEIQNSLSQLKALGGKMQLADQLKQIIEQRKEQIRQYLSKFTKLPNGITNIYQDYSKQLIYYKQQVTEYKEMLNDPDKMMKKAIELANKIPAFQNFIKSNSMLAGLFNLSGEYNPSIPGQGMPTRDMVMAAFQGQSGLTSQTLSGIVQKNVETASGQIDELKDKFSGIGLGGGSSLDIKNFKPSSQKTKSFLKRLEFGTNIQTVRSNYFFPTTTDLGLSLGYKLDDKNVVGIGVSYKIGWGSGFDHIKITSQGIGLRSFLDVNIKGNFFASGGFEYNYQKVFSNLSQLKRISDWQKSGLLGIGKIVSIRSQAVKKTKIQLLWDFLSYQQIPRTQPFIFRIGYTF